MTFSNTLKKIPFKKLTINVSEYMNTPFKNEHITLIMQSLPFQDISSDISTHIETLAARMYLVKF